MENTIIVLRVDNTPSEDESYDIGAFSIPSDRVDEFAEQARELHAELKNGDHGDDDLVLALQDKGWKLSSMPILLLTL